MPTSPETADFLLEQLGGQVRLHRMFGEYAVKVGAKTVGLLCDDALFVRQLPEVTALLGDPVAGLPYPGAKPSARAVSIRRRFSSSTSVSVMPGGGEPPLALRNRARRIAGRAACPAAGRPGASGRPGAT